MYPPCGECAGCKLREEVAKVLAMVDRRMLPFVFDAQRDIARETRYREPPRETLDYLYRRMARAKAQWLEARERYLTSDVLRWTECIPMGMRIAYIVPGFDRPSAAAWWLWWEVFARTWGWIGIAAAGERIWR